MLTIIPGRGWIVWMVAIIAICLFVLVLVRFVGCVSSTKKDRYDTTFKIAGGYYKKLTTNEMASMNVDPTQYDVINVWIDYQYMPSGVTSFEGIVQTGSTNTSWITFLANVAPISGSSVTMPITNQFGTFCMPLVTIPKISSSSTTTTTTTASPLSPIAFGCLINGTAYTIPLTQMVAIKVHIFDTDAGPQDLPTMTPPTTLFGGSSMITSISIPSSSTPALTLTQIRQAMDSGTALYMPTVVATSNTSQFVIGSTIYMGQGATTTQQNTDSPGMWFSATAAGTPTFYSSATATPYLLLSTKFDNYPISGMIVSPTAVSCTLSSTGSNALSISYNGAPVHPTGCFPSQFQTPGTNNSSCGYQVAAYCGPNPNKIAAFTTNQTMSGTATAGTSSTTYGSMLRPGIIGYCFDNIPIYAAGDAENYNPLAREVGDVFMCHADESSTYHRHFISPSIYNWTIDTKLRVVGFFMDMYPIVAPFLINDPSGTGSRVINTKDLTYHHGLKAGTGQYFTVSFTPPSSTTPISLQYDFVYVATFDFPYTIGSFYGTVSNSTNPSMNMNTMSSSNPTNPSMNMNTMSPTMNMSPMSPMSPTNPTNPSMNMNTMSPTMNMSPMSPTNPTMNMNTMSPTMNMSPMSPTNPTMNMNTMSPTMNMNTMSPMSPTMNMNTMSPTMNMNTMSPMSPTMNMNTMSPTNPSMNMNTMSPTMNMYTMSPTNTMSPTTNMYTVSPTNTMSPTTNMYTVSPINTMSPTTNMYTMSPINTMSPTTNMYTMSPSVNTMSPSVNTMSPTNPTNPSTNMSQTNPSMEIYPVHPSVIITHHPHNTTTSVPYSNYTTTTTSPVMTNGSITTTMTPAILKSKNDGFVFR